jgi:hypothetical protein
VHRKEWPLLEEKVNEWELRKNKKLLTQ